MTSLRTYLYVHRTERAVRVLLISALLGGLLVSVLPTGFFDLVDLDKYDERNPLDLGAHVVPGTMFNDVPPQVLSSSPAACFMKTEGVDRRRWAFTSMIVFQVILINGFIIRVGRLFQSTSIGLKRLVVETVDRFHGQALSLWEERLLSMRPSVGLIVAAICIPMQTGLYFCVRMFLDLYSSMLIEVCQSSTFHHKYAESRLTVSQVISLVLAAAYGNARLSETRELGNEEDNAWSFGQVLPLVLLAYPAYSLFQVFGAFLFRPEKCQ